MASAGPEQPVAAQIEHHPSGPSAPKTATTADTSSYAQREQQDHQVANYEGGSFVVIGVSGSAILVVLLILLLI